MNSIMLKVKSFHFPRTIKRSATIFISCNADNLYNRIGHFAPCLKITVFSRASYKNGKNEFDLVKHLDVFLIFCIHGWWTPAVVSDP
jgi:hypothetical protein